MEAIVYYRGDIKECWTCRHGDYITGNKKFYDSYGMLKFVKCGCKSSVMSTKVLISAYGNCNKWERKVER